MNYESPLMGSVWRDIVNYCNHETRRIGAYHINKRHLSRAATRAKELKQTSAKRTFFKRK